MTIGTKISPQQFDTFVDRPDNADRTFELIGGEIVEMPSNPYTSQIAALIIAALVAYLKTNPIGHVTGEAGGYQVSGERYAPDAAFILKSRQPELAKSGYNPLPPDLAAEVISPTDSDKRLRIKIANYLAANTQVWVVYPAAQEVEIYPPGQPVQIVANTETITAGALLPGFALPLADIFP